MEMVPRRRGRPRKTDLVIKPTVRNDEIGQALDVDKAKEIADKVSRLEQEKKELQKKLDAIELANKGLTPERLSQKTILSADDKKRLEQKIHYCNLMLQGHNEVLSSGNGISVESRGDLITDKDLLRSQKVKAEFALKAGLTPEINSSDESRLYTRKKELEDVIRDRRASIGDEWDNRDQYEFSRTVQNKMRYMEECTKLELELKNINKILEPENSNAGNLGYLSPKRSRNL